LAQFLQSNFIKAARW